MGTIAVFTMHKTMIKKFRNIKLIGIKNDSPYTTTRTGEQNYGICE